MSDAFRLWCKHFTSRSPVCQDDMHVTSDEKNCSQNTPETGTKKRTLFNISLQNLCNQFMTFQSKRWILLYKDFWKSSNRGVLHPTIKVYEVRLLIFYHYCYPFFTFHHNLYIMMIKKTASGIFATGTSKKTRKKSTCTVWIQKHGN